MSQNFKITTSLIVKTIIAIVFCLSVASDAHAQVVFVNTLSTPSPASEPKGRFYGSPTANFSTSTETGTLETIVYYGSVWFVSGLNTGTHEFQFYLIKNGTQVTSCHSANYNIDSQYASDKIDATTANSLANTAGTTTQTMIEDSPGDCDITSGDQIGVGVKRMSGTCSIDCEDYDYPAVTSGTRYQRVYMYASSPAPDVDPETDYTRIITFDEPGFQETYATNTIPINFTYYQSASNTRADYWKATFTNLLTGTGYVATGTILTSLYGDTYEVDSTKTLSENGQYSCKLQLFESEREVELLQMTLYDSLINTWSGSCLFNINMSVPWPNQSIIPTIDGSLTTATNTNTSNIFENFFDTLFSKHPFAWPIQFIIVVKEASLFEQASTTFEVELDLMVASRRNSTSTSVIIPDIATTTGLVTFGEEQICYIEVNEQSVCTLTKTLITYALWVMFMLFWLSWTRQFISDHNEIK